MTIPKTYEDRIKNIHTLADLDHQMLLVKKLVSQHKARSTRASTRNARCHHVILMQHHEDVLRLFRINREKIENQLNIKLGK